jgi:two-component system chemotaxis response regulator CheY
VKILIIDDSLTMRRIVRDCLKQIGLEDVIEAENGAEGLKAAQERRDIALALCDWHMPVMDGLQFVSNMKSSPATRDIPVIMVTSEREKSNVVGALRAGAQDYVVKPFSAEVLAGKIESLLAARHEQGLAQSGSNLAGRIGDTAVSELIQIMSRTRKSGVLDLEAASGHFRVFLDDGKVVAAEGPDVSGEEAFFQAFGLSAGTFSFRAGVEADTPNITRPLNALLLDAARREQ